MNKLKESWREFKNTIKEFGLINTIKYWLNDSENLLIVWMAFILILNGILFYLTIERSI